MPVLGRDRGPVIGAQVGWARVANLYASTAAVFANDATLYASSLFYGL
jgi:hypothetical protein